MATMDLSTNQEVMGVQSIYDYAQHMFKRKETFEETDIQGNINLFNNLKTEANSNHGHHSSSLFEVKCLNENEFEVDNTLFSYSSFKKAMDLRTHNRQLDGRKRTIFEDAEYFAKNYRYQLLPITLEPVDETIIQSEHNYSLMSLNSESEAEENCSRTMDYSEIKEKNYKRRRTKFRDGSDTEEDLLEGSTFDGATNGFTSSPRKHFEEKSFTEEEPRRYTPELGNSGAVQPLDLSAAPLVQEEKTDSYLRESPSSIVENDEVTQLDSDKENVSSELNGILVTITRPDEKENYQPCDLFLNDIARLVPKLIDKDCLEVDILDRTCERHDEFRKHRLYYVISESTWRLFQKTNERVILTNDQSLGQPLRKMEKDEKPSYLVFDQFSLAKCLADYCQEIGGCFEYTCVEEECLKEEEIETCLRKEEKKEEELKGEEKVKEELVAKKIERGWKEEAKEAVLKGKGNEKEDLCVEETKETLLHEEKEKMDLKEAVLNEKEEEKEGVKEEEEEKEGVEEEEEEKEGVEEEEEEKEGVEEEEEEKECVEEEEEEKEGVEEEENENAGLKEDEKKEERLKGEEEESKNIDGTVEVEEKFVEETEKEPKEEKIAEKSPVQSIKNLAGAVPEAELEDVPGKKQDSSDLGKTTEKESSPSKEKKALEMVVPASLESEEKVSKKTEETKRKQADQETKEKPKETKETETPAKVSSETTVVTDKDKTKKPSRGTKRKRKSSIQRKPKNSPTTSGSKSTSESETSQKSDKPVSSRKGRREPVLSKEEPPNKISKTSAPEKPSRKTRSGKVLQEVKTNRSTPKKTESGVLTTRTSRQKKKTKEEGRKKKEEEETGRSLRSHKTAQWKEKVQVWSKAKGRKR